MRAYLKPPVAGLAIALSLAPAWAAPVETAITYQGQLKHGGVPVTQINDKRNESSIHELCTEPCVEGV